MINEDIVNNKVDANNQCKYFTHTFGSNTPKSFRIMFIGNSITRHEVKPEIGWYNEFGMAASKESNDYVHKVTSFIEKETKKDVYALIFNAGSFELDFHDKEVEKEIINSAKEFKPEVIVFRLGENAYKKDLDIVECKKCFKHLILKLNELAKKVIVTNLFWRMDMLDNMLEEIANELNLPFVSINDLGDSESNKAIGCFKNESVAAHPNDLGMKKIADRINETLFRKK